MAGASLQVKKRLIAVMMIFTALIMALLVRIGWIQLVQGEWYQKMAFIQQNQNRVISPKRGTIYDRNGIELAVSASVETISVNPQALKKSGADLDMIAQSLSEILGMSKDDVAKKLNKSSRYEVIKKKVDKEVGDKVRKWRQDKNIDGIYIDEDTKRFYPYRNLAAHVIGFTGTDNQGLDGIEAVMEQYLKGTPGKILSEVDAGGNEVPFKEEKHIDPQDGLNVVLTIDETIQHLAEKVIENAIADNKVLNGATAIVMDPRTGDILALSSKPDFDLNNPYACPPGEDASTWKGNTQEDIKKLQETVWRDKAVADTYEPGSTFKAITTSAGIEENVVTPDTPVNDFPVTVGGWKINCWRATPHGNETFAEGVYNSCNPVFVRVAQSLGVDKFYKYLKAFGFYDKTQIELPGETKSIIHSKPTEVNMATASFGQRFQITPIQLITAYGAIANGGKLMKPRLVKELTDQDGNIVKKFEPEVVRNVISKQTSDTVKNILEGVVTYGTGRNAYVKGYRVAGKTGTAETLESKTKGRYIASFSAFAPADNPVICVLVVLDFPTGPYGHQGGAIAAPVAGKLVEDVLSYLEVDRRYTEKDKEMMAQEVNVPDVRNITVEEAKKTLKQFSLEYKIEGSGSVIVDQMPKPNASVPQKSVVVLYTTKSGQQAMVKVPDVLNKTIGEATQALNDAGLNIKVIGMGTAVKQSAAPGSNVAKGDIIQVEFRSLDTE
ncbi:MAG: penicillin-binding transpeptidase domain-containing protein [Clostridiales bacterium]|nr:penicillin-binding transpeptidase domain-containing protein [Eubacteriales bacterium]MDH7564931.1 penicillin-binding transpeptidase domain-containing protein [Clostridiales bacterium]